MTPAGQAKIDAAREDGSWSLLDQVDSMELPDDLKLALAAVPGAEDCYRDYSDSIKKRTLYHIISAKRSVTREKRINEVVELAARGRSLEDRYRVERGKSQG
jgi:uncharacterized protein YdeI (YjbR/CyaY-like superfamily)